MTHRILCFLALCLVAVWSAPVAAQEFETRAAQAFLLDAETGVVLLARDADAPAPPASLAKLMTMELVFRAIVEGRLSLDDSFAVSENAWRTGGAPSGTSTMFAKLGSSVRLEDLIQGAIVQSANDACIVIAEGMAGSEAEFARLMTERARELGLPKSVFKNATGLPAEGQVVTMRELAMLGRHIWSAYPQFYRYYSQADFTWNGIRQTNRNPLLKMDIGADGMKTGYTERSGFAIVGSASRGGRRLFAALSGLPSDTVRAQEARRVLEWGLNGFRKRVIFAEGETVGEASVYGGARGVVALAAEGPVSILVPVGDGAKLTARIVYEGPLAAPVEKGAPVGALQVWSGETLAQQTPLFAAESVARGPLHRRALDAIEELALGWLR